MYLQRDLDSESLFSWSCHSLGKNNLQLNIKHTVGSDNAVREKQRHGKRQKSDCGGVLNKAVRKVLSEA